MKRLLILLLGLSAMVMPLLAQDVDETFVFVDENGTRFENGSTVIRNVIENDGTSEIIKAGVYVLNVNAGPNDYLKMYYTVNLIDNGIYQICFPSTCNMKDCEGAYQTPEGQLMGTKQDIQSEWFPVADGVCDVTLTIEVLSRSAGFPPTYTHKGYGPTLNIKFVKGEVPGPQPVVGDVNGDGEVSISDVNTLIDIVLTGASDNEAADVNTDGEINISDVNTLIDIILN